MMNSRRSSMVNHWSHMMYEGGHMMHNWKCVNLMSNFSRSLNNSLYNRGMGNSMSYWKSKRSWSNNRSSNRSCQGSNRSSSWEVKASIKEDLRISLRLTLVQTMKTMNRLVTPDKGTSIARCSIRSGQVGVRSIVVQGIGFRLSQAERGYGENYDLETKFLSVFALSNL